MLIDGDASTMMHLSDWDTVVRCKMPLLVVVLNDEALGSELLLRPRLSRRSPRSMPTGAARS